MLHNEVNQIDYMTVSITYKTSKPKEIPIKQDVLIKMIINSAHNHCKFKNNIGQDINQ